ncbi:hypothetical protein AC249_AIPGENE15991 [Exaiptasia diaphana]|nr:hypothetical protein AC249_AIPGENE15991 [Exaiptasia diaphana]
MDGKISKRRRYQNPQADLNGCEKMEKAEILELTVNYIKSINTRGNIGDWKRDCTSRSNPGCNCFSHSARKDKSTEILCRDSLQNYRTRRTTSSSTAVPSSYHCANGKVYCTCVSSVHYEFATSPLSPEMSGAGVNSQYGARAQAESIRQWKSPPTGSIASPAPSTLNKVWRPW